MEGLLNPKFVKDQKLTKGDIAKITLLHNEKDMLFAEMKELEADDPSLRSYVERIQDLEFRMQDAWKWDRDADKHTHWFQAPHCKCPYMDNWDLFGTKYRTITGSCPLHGAK